MYSGELYHVWPHERRNVSGRSRSYGSKGSELSKEVDNCIKRCSTSKNQKCTSCNNIQKRSMSPVNEYLDSPQKHYGTSPKAHMASANSDSSS